MTETTGDGGGYGYDAASHIWKYHNGRYLKVMMACKIDAILLACIRRLKRKKSDPASKKRRTKLKIVKQHVLSLEFLNGAWQWLLHRLYREMQFDRDIEEWCPLNDGHSINLKTAEVQTTPKERYCTAYLDVSKEGVTENDQTRLLFQKIQTHQPFEFNELCSIMTSFRKSQPKPIDSRQKVRGGINGINGISDPVEAFMTDVIVKTNDSRRVDYKVIYQEIFEVVYTTLFYTSRSGYLLKNSAGQRIEKGQKWYQ